MALLRSLNRPSDAISALVKLVDAVPTDAEAWCELADLYQSQGLCLQAIFSLEEALLIAPNAWNVSPGSIAIPKRGLLTLSRFMRGLASCFMYVPRLSIATPLDLQASRSSIFVEASSFVMITYEDFTDWLW